MEKKNWNNNFLFFILIIIALEAILFFTSTQQLDKKQKLEEEKFTKTQIVFEEVPTLAKAISIYDQTIQKEIYRKNGNAVLPLASLSKIMTALVALEKYQSNDILTISRKSKEENPNGSLILGEKWQIADLVKFTLVSSSNDGTLALADDKEQFLERMNKKAGEIGMFATTFLNTTGLDFGSEKAGSYGKASDVNIMALFAVKNYPEIFEVTTLPEITFKSETKYIHKIKNTNIIIEKIPNLFFSKTGFTTLAGGNLTVVFENKAGHILAITLLGSTKEGRFSDMGKLVEIANTLQ